MLSVLVWGTASKDLEHIVRAPSNFAFLVVDSEALLSGALALFFFLLWFYWPAISQRRKEPLGWAVERRFCGWAELRLNLITERLSS